MNATGSTALAMENAALRAEVERLKAENEAVLSANRDVMLHWDVLKADYEKLRTALREAYEVYAGSDGFIPETAAEGYQQQIIRQMMDCISAALEEKP